MGKGSKKKPPPDKPDWKKLEEIIATIQKDLAPDAVVRHNHKIRGRSGRLRQLDVTISQKVSTIPVLIVFECKRYTRPVSIEKVEAFATKLRDIRTPYGVMVSNIGFDAGAKAIAAQENIILKNYREADETDWKQLVVGECWAATTRYRLEKRKVSIELDSQLEIIDAPFNIHLYKENGDSFDDSEPDGFTLSHLFYDAWDKQKRPRPIGEIKLVVDGLTPPAFVQSNGQSFKIKKLTYTGKMVVRKYAMNLQLNKGKVLEDDTSQNQEYIELKTNSFRLDQISKDQDGVIVSPEEWNKMELEPSIEVDFIENAAYRFTLIGGTQ